MTRVILHEVGLRDGLQMEHETVPTDLKLQWIRRLMGTGIDILQIGSFVHPTKVPQMADTDELFQALRASREVPAEVTLSGLVLNERGLERALASGCGMICVGVSASETHSMKNTGMSVADATRRILATAQKARDAGLKVQVSVQSAFGCGFEGPVPPERVLAIVRRYHDAGFAAISLADTAGHAVPDQVERLFAEVAAVAGGGELACHFHNTYGLGLANTCAAMRAGVTSFESSVAGLGGCPFTKVAGGNVCTEDFVHMLQHSGLREDVHLDRLTALAADISTFFGRDLPGSVYKVGEIPRGAVNTLPSVRS
jgi:hydroxymethylglutaryl-CoA lyase